MKIAFFCASTTFSGGRLVLFRHANELARRGHAVTIWVDNPIPKVTWQDLAVPLASFSRSSLRQLPAAEVCVFDRIRLARPLWQAYRGRVAHFCQGFEGTDTELRMQTIRDQSGLILGLPKLWRLWRRLRAIDQAYQLPTIKLVVHRHLSDLMRRRFGQLAHLVPNGLPEGVFTPSPKRSSSRLTILVVGPTDVGCKRIADALQAVRLLKLTRPEVRLLRVAQHPQRELESRLGVTDEYHTMVPPVAMAQLYRRADVLLVPSSASEGFGLPVLEAMACGLPCVVTDIPTFRTFAQPADYALFVPVGDVSTMAKVLEQLLDAPAQRQRLASRGLEVAAQYTLQRSFDAMEKTLLTMQS